MAIVTAAQNIKFNGTLDDVVVLDVDGDNRTVVLYDDLPPADQALLDQLVTAYGGDAPLAAATAGYTSLMFGAALVGTESAGLSQVAAATSAEAQIGYGGALTGTDATGLSATKRYSFMVETDGGYVGVNFLGSAATTVDDLVIAINADLGALATAALTGGDIVITAASEGSKSHVSVIDTSRLFASIVGYTGITTIRGVSPTTYSLTLMVDGTLVELSILGSDVQTLDDLVTELDTGCAGAATSAIVDASIVITSATTGVGSSVKVVGGNLVGMLNDCLGVGPSWDGAETLLDAFNNARTANGAPYKSIIPFSVVGVKPHAATATIPTGGVYFGGAPADWRYMSNDAVV